MEEIITICENFTREIVKNMDGPNKIRKDEKKSDKIDGCRGLTAHFVTSFSLLSIFCWLFFPSLFFLQARITYK